MCRRSPKGIHLPSKLLAAFLRVEQFSSYLLAAWLLTHSLAFSQQNPAPLELPRAPLIHLDAAMLPMEESPTNKDATETKASPVQRWLDQSPQHWDFIAPAPQKVRPCDLTETMTRCVCSAPSKHSLPVVFGW
jgi:hypothetical protein